MRLGLAEDGDILPVGLAVIAGLLVARYLYLVSHRTSNFSSSTALGPAEPPTSSATSTLLPSSSGFRLWPSRTERLEADTAFVVAHTDFLLARIEQAKAMGGLVRARMELAEIIESIRTSAVAAEHAPGTAAPREWSLTLHEIEEMVAALPDVSPQLRQSLMRLLSARLQEKQT